MSQARSQADPQFTPDSRADQEPDTKQPNLAELRASLALERDAAIDAVNKSIRIAGLIEGMSDDIKSGLTQSLEVAKKDLKNIDPETIADAGGLLEAAQFIKSISLGSSWKA